MWRIQAKHETVCPRCRGYIKKGSWIVQEQGSARWAHSVCPGELRKKQREVEQRTEPMTYEEFNPETGEFETRTL